MYELKFDASLGFQQEAVQAITDIFRGQKVCQSNFSVRKIADELNFEGEVHLAETGCKRRGPQSYNERIAKRIYRNDG